MGKLKLNSVVSTEITGVANVNANVENSLNIAPLQYVSGYGYFVPRQKFHAVAVNYNGQEFNSNRVFAVELKRDSKNEWIPTGNLTAIKLATFRQTHFGEVKDGEAAPVIPTRTDDEGKLRMTTTGVKFVAGCTGVRPVKSKDLTPYIPSGVLCEYMGQVECYSPKFSEERTLMADEDENLVLDKIMVHKFNCELSDLEYELGDIIDLSGANAQLAL